jgi:hypothetical protein
VAKENALRRERDRKMRPTELVGGAPKLDRLIHERLRLGILSALAVNESLTFNELKKLLETTDGNLSVHASSKTRSMWPAANRSRTGCPRRNIA